MTDAAPRLFALSAVSSPRGGTVVGVIAKRTYEVRGGRCTVASEQVPLVEEPLVDPDSDELLHDADTTLSRTKVDVVVRGKAYAPLGQRVFDARVRVADVDRTLRVYGDRTCSLDAMGRVRFSDPAPVEAVDVGWKAAYGGVDAVALARRGDPLEPLLKDQDVTYRPRFGSFVYPRNRAGKGYLLEATPEGLEGCRLPNLEDPADLLTPERMAVGQRYLWPSCPLPASFGWLAYTSFPRMAMLGSFPAYDRERCPVDTFPEVRAGLLDARCLDPKTAIANRFDVAVAQQAAPGMRASEILPGAQVELTSLHPSAPVWMFQLAAEVPRMAIEIPRSSVGALAPRIRTLLVEPDKDRICVVWVGEHVEPVPIGPGTRAKVRFAVRWD